jgi:PKD repeat protein
MSNRPSFEILNPFGKLLHTFSVKPAPRSYYAPQGGRMKRQRLCHVRRYPRPITTLIACFSLSLGFLAGAAHAQSLGGAMSGPAYQLLSQRVVANQMGFYVYLDQDAGFNHGFPSGFYASNGNLGSIHIDTGCIDDPQAVNGCSGNPDALDRVRGTVMRISFDPQTPGNFAGVNIEEPQDWGVLGNGNGYDLRGANNIIFDVRSPEGATIQVGVGGCMTGFFTVPSTWTTMTIGLNTLSCTPDLSNVHILFGVGTNDTNAPSGGTVLFDNIRFDPVPTSHQSVLGFPLGNQTFGVVPKQNAPIPSDQSLRNLTTTYETALTVIALLARGTAQDLVNARMIADALDYALHHDNHGDALPVASDGSVGLHNGYECGDIALFNNQQPPGEGQAGDIRLAGFTATVLCPSSGFCLVLDGATGGNNAFAVLALVAAFQRFGDVRYLNDAETIGHWIVDELTDTSGTGYGGYFAGYPDSGVPPPKPLQTGKSTENNADIFAAFTALATVEAQLGQTSEAANWTAAANVAGDFVLQMFDANRGGFNAGTVPSDTSSSPASGNCPSEQQKGTEVINTCDFLDVNTFTTLALAGAGRYQNQIDWRRPISYVQNHFATTVTATGQIFNGFDLVAPQTSGSNGVAWEFTGQTVVAMRYVDQLYAQTTFEASATGYVAEMLHAQTAAPFGDGLGLVASTLEAGDTLPPLDQCLATPFQCIAERVGVATTTWAIFADQSINPFSALSALSAPVASFTASTTSGTAALTVTFTDTSTGSPTGWQWAFGDGGTSTSENPSHTYTTAGTYTVTLTASNSAGSSSASQTVTVNIAQPVPPVYEADFTASRTSGKAPLAVHFAYSSTESVTKCLWNFGDGHTSKVHSPSHTYTRAGTYTVTLTVTGPWGAYTCTKPNYISAYTAPKANFSATPKSGVTPLLVNFANMSTGVVTGWLWHFGDGSTSTDESPGHTYDSPKTYTAKLTVYGPGGSSSKTESIRVEK